ncbi:MAG: hypothetical protein SFW35_04915 [Chitinophagales bacterium]|nr:hypothetical protein [Chitinophagales bacterium]
MTYLSIDTKSEQAKKFVALLETLPFVKILDEPNAVTRRAMKSAKEGKARKHKNSKDLIEYLGK